MIQLEEMKVKFVDLQADYLEQKKEIDRAVKKVLRAGRYILGENVEKFETTDGLASYHNH